MNEDYVLIRKEDYDLYMNIINEGGRDVYTQEDGIIESSGIDPDTFRTLRDNILYIHKFFGPNAEIKHDNLLIKKGKMYGERM